MSDVDRHPRADMHLAFRLVEGCLAGPDGVYNNDANESITQVTALLRSVVAPTAEAQTILGDLGLTAEDLRTSIGEQGLVATLQMLDDKLGGNREQLNRLGDAHSDLIRRGNEAVNPFLKERYYEAAEAVAVQRRAMDETWASAGRLKDELDITGEEALDMATNTDVMSAATDEATGAVDATTAALEAEQQQIQETVDAFSAMADALSAQFDPLFGAQDATMNLRDAQEAAAEAAAEFGAESEEAADANREVVRAAAENEQAQYKLRAAIEAGDVSIGDAKVKLQQWVEQGVITQKEADQTAYEFALLAGAANSLPKSVNISVTANTSSVYQELREAAGAISAFNASNGVNLNVYRGQGAVSGRHTGGPMLDGETYLVGERGPELVRMNGSGVIHNTGDTEQMLSGASGGSGATGGMHFNGPVTFGDKRVLPALDYFTASKLTGV